jgi:hypothetical protein
MHLQTQQFKPFVLPRQPAQGNYERLHTCLPAVQAPASVMMPPLTGAAHQQAPPALQFGGFGNVTLPSAIEGSVDSEAPAPMAGQGEHLGSPHGELTAEQQHAFMKAKAAEKARLLQEQEVRSWVSRIAVPAARQQLLFSCIVFSRFPTLFTLLRSPV